MPKSWIFRGSSPRGTNLEEARRLLASALTDMAETNLLLGESLPLPDTTVTDLDADLEERISLYLRAANQLGTAS